MKASKLRRLRESVGLSQAQFAKLLKLNRTTVWRWEVGDVEISPISAIAIEAMVEKLAQKAAA